VKIVTRVEEFEQIRSVFKTCLFGAGNQGGGAPTSLIGDTCRIDFDLLFTGRFFGKVKSLVQESGEKFFWLSVLDPDPKQYFFKHFGHFGALQCEVADDARSYVAAVNQDPGGSPADALIHNSNVVVLCSLSGDWIVVGRRNFDLAVCVTCSQAGGGSRLSSLGPVVVPIAALEMGRFLTGLSELGN
jgi:hypothetical protein